MIGIHWSRRVVLAVLVLGVGLIHLLDLPGKWSETRWMGIGYLGLIAASIVCAELLLSARGAVPLLLAAGVCAGPLLGFVLTRTTGLPGAQEDVGNWQEPLGMASLFVEAAALALVAVALTPRVRSAALAGTAGIPAPRTAEDQDTPVRSRIG